MASKRPPGLIKRNGIWHIDKRAKWLPTGRLRESCETSSQEEAERYLIHRLEQLRQQSVYGARREYTFEEGAARYITENGHVRTLLEVIAMLERLMPYIGHLPLRQVHRGALDRFVADMAGLSPKTINNYFAVVRRITTLAARLWRDENGAPWLDTPPLIPGLPVTDAGKPYPLDWREQSDLFSRLPAHVARAALFAVNVGCREQEVCGLRWEWERRANGRSVFVLPASVTKSATERLVVLNTIAQSVLEAVRGLHAEWVFVYPSRAGVRRLPSLYGKVWRKAWREAGLPMDDGIKKGCHNLRHTAGRRLRAAGVPVETRRVILGHATGDLTTHYSAAEIEELQRAVDLLVEQRPGTVLRAVG